MTRRNDRYCKQTPAVAVYGIRLVMISFSNLEGMCGGSALSFIMAGAKAARMCQLEDALHPYCFESGIANSADNNTLRAYIVQYYFCVSRFAHQRVAAILSLGLGVFWAVQRASSYAWIIQNILSVAFLVTATSSLKVPNLKLITVFLAALLVYDVFFVFITPFLTKDGSSIMVRPRHYIAHESWGVFYVGGCCCILVPKRLVGWVPCCCVYRG